MNKGLVIAREADALRVDAIHKALREAKTVGQFRAMLPPGEFERLFDDDVNDEAEQVSDDDAFDGYSMPAVCDGDYPPWLQQSMGNLLPNDLCSKFGKGVDTPNGGYLHIDPAEADALIAELRQRGFTIERGAHFTFC